jgi:hypothetical protein
MRTRNLSTMVAMLTALAGVGALASEPGNGVSWVNVTVPGGMTASDLLSSIPGSLEIGRRVPPGAVSRCGVEAGGLEVYNGEFLSCDFAVRPGDAAFVRMTPGMALASPLLRPSMEDGSTQPVSFGHGGTCANCSPSTGKGRIKGLGGRQEDGTVTGFWFMQGKGNVFIGKGNDSGRITGAMTRQGARWLHQATGNMTCNADVEYAVSNITSRADYDFAGNPSTLTDRFVAVVESVAGEGKPGASGQVVILSAGFDSGGCPRFNLDKISSGAASSCCAVPATNQATAIAVPPVVVLNAADAAGGKIWVSAVLPADDPSLTMGYFDVAPQSDLVVGYRLYSMSSAEPPSTARRSAWSPYAASNLRTPSSLMIDAAAYEDGHQLWLASSLIVDADGDGAPSAADYETEFLSQAAMVPKPVLQGEVKGFDVAGAFQASWKTTSETTIKMFRVQVSATASFASCGNAGVVCRDLYAAGDNDAHAYVESIPASEISTVLNDLRGFYFRLQTVRTSGTIESSAPIYRIADTADQTD